MPPTRRLPAKWSMSPPPARWCRTGRCWPTPRSTRRNGRSSPIHTTRDRIWQSPLDGSCKDRRASRRLAMFELDQFIADLRATLSERSRQPMKEVVARAVADPASLIRGIGEPDKAGVQVLHRSPDLTVLNLLWAPSHIALPHDQRVAALIGMNAGREDNMV